MSDDDSTVDAVLPDGVEHRTFDGRERLSTWGEPVYDGLVDSGDWHAQDTGRSKLGTMLELDMDTDLVGSESVLYLGTVSGTTASHVTDFAGPTCTVGSAPRPVRDLVDAAEDRDNLFPLLKDARDPGSYAYAAGTGIDCLVMDMTARGQATAVVRGRQFPAGDDRLLMAIKAHSEGMAAEPDDVFDDMIAELDSACELLETARPDRFHADHFDIIAWPK